MSSDHDVIDLCDSSFAVEGTSQSSTPSSTKKTVADGIIVAVAKVKSGSTFWDSSSEGECASPPPKQKSRDRRNSKLVTPDETQRNLREHPSFSSDSDWNGKHCAKRKPPRVLFSNNPKAVNLASTPKIEDSVLLGHARAIHRNVQQKSWQSYGSSSSDDESVKLVTSGLTRKKSAKKSSAINSSVFLRESVAKPASSDEQDEDIDNKASKKATIALGPSAVINTSHSVTLSRNNASCILGLQNLQSYSRRLLRYPSVGPRSCQQHEDLRARYILALWRYARTLVSASYNMTKLDAYCRRIRDLALLKEFPVRSLGEYVGDRYGLENNSLYEALTVGGVDQIETPFQRESSVHGYYSIAEAALVGMLEHLENRSESTGVDFVKDAQAVQFCEEKDNWVFLKDLITLIDRRLDSELAPARMEASGEDDNGELLYTNPSTRSAEFKQLEQLTKEDAGHRTPFLRSHRRNKRLCFELTLRGLQTARSIRHRQFPAPPSYIRTSKLYEDGLDPSFDGICLVVDQREGGGASKKLHTLCQGLDMRKVPYIVTKLDIGDYAFASMDTQKLIPIIIERKSIQDVAQSIWDGRWTSQKRRMYQGQYVFGFENCRLAYLIEGRPDGQELTGGAMGQVRFNVSREKLDSELDSLCQEGFEVITTNNMNGSMAKLAEICKSVSNDYRSGKLTAEYTYEGFMQRVRSIPVGTDFSRIAKDRSTLKAATTLSRSVAENEPSNGGPNCLVPDEKSMAAIKHGADLASRYNSWKVTQLKEECDKHGLPKTGNKVDLINRLLGPHPPKAWLTRKNASLYVPSRYDTCASAIMVAIWMHQRRKEESWKGMEKEDIITLSERLDISKDPFSGTGKGIFNYDGWSCMGQLREGQSPLVFRQKGGLFKLTTIGGELSGFHIASMMHDWCHAHNKCRCNDFGLDE